MFRFPGDEGVLGLSWLRLTGGWYLTFSAGRFGVYFVRYDR